MVPDTVNGLPLHPLVVHAVVVLLPLACLGVIAVAVRSTWRARYAGLVLAATAVATAAIPVATNSGQSLERRVGNPGQHAELGDTLIWFAVPLLAAAAALFVLQRRAARAAVPTTGGAHAAAPAPMGSAPAMGSALAMGSVSAAPVRTTPLTLGVAVLAVVIAVANLVQVYRVGDSGARAVWQGVQSVPAQGH
jgi:uncharacterized membrane protein